MADWNKFWERMNEAIPDDVILQDSNVFGDYLDGQYVAQLANQVCQECGLSWHIDWDTVRVIYTTDDPTTFIKEMTGNLVVTDGEHEERRPACGLGTASNKDGVNAKQRDTVCKGALTDLIKNGWMRFGRRLGGQLYFGKNPHLAEALGWKVSERQRRPQASQEAVAPSDLGSYTIHPGGWSKDNKFGGMTLKEVYEDPDGYGSMSWAATLDAPRSATAKMAQYFKMREQEEEGGVPDGVSLEEFDEGVTVHSYDNTIAVCGKRVAQWQPIVEKGLAPIINRMVQANVGEDKLFGHAKHVRNHLKSHFKVAKVVDLTGEQADAFVRYVESGGRDADPRFYGPITQEDVEAGKAAIREMSTEPLFSPGRVPVPAVVEVATTSSGEATAQLFGPESVEDLLKKAAPHLPKAWQDKPEKWWADLCKQFDIGIMNATQLETVRALLGAVASGSMSLEDKDSATYKVFGNGMKQVADDA